jgi:hypothetical protein
LALSGYALNLGARFSWGRGLAPSITSIGTAIYLWNMNTPMCTTHTTNISTTRTGAGRNRIPTGTPVSRLSTPTRITQTFIIDTITDAYDEPASQSLNQLRPRRRSRPLTPIWLYAQARSAILYLGQIYERVSPFVEGCSLVFAVIQSIVASKRPEMTNVR